MISESEIQAEIADMREHIPFLNNAREAALRDYNEQAERTYKVYGRTAGIGVPAGSEFALDALAQKISTLEDKITAANKYLAELEA